MRADVRAWPSFASPVGGILWVCDARLVVGKWMERISELSCRLRYCSARGCAMTLGKIGQDACLHRISDNFRVERPLSGQVFLHSED